MDISWRKARHVTAPAFFAYFCALALASCIPQCRRDANVLPGGTFKPRALFHPLAHDRGGGARGELQCRGAAWPVTGPIRRINIRTIGTRTAAKMDQL